MLLYSTEEEWPFRDIVESTTGGDMFVKLKIKKKQKKISIASWCLKKTYVYISVMLISQMISVLRLIQKKTGSNSSWGNVFFSSFIDWKRWMHSVYILVCVLYISLIRFVKITLEKPWIK